MPGKSRRKKGKYTPQGKGKPEGVIRPTVVTQQPQAVTRQAAPPTPPKVSTPPAGLRTPAAKPSVLRQRNIGTELRTIGIITGIILIILVVLARVLS